MNNFYSFLQCLFLYRKSFHSYIFIDQKGCFVAVYCNFERKTEKQCVGAHVTIKKKKPVFISMGDVFETKHVKF